MIPANGRADAAYSTQTKLKRRANARPNRGPHKQVFVCGVAERSGPVRQDRFLYGFLTHLYSMFLSSPTIGNRNPWEF